MNKLELVSYVYNTLEKGLESFIDFGYYTEKNQEVSANLLYLIGAILNDSDIDIEFAGATHMVLQSINQEFYNAIRKYLNLV